MQTTVILEQFNGRDSTRMQSYRELLDFYRGQQWPGRERWGEKRLTFNYARIFIDKLTSYLMAGRNFIVESTGDTPDESRRAVEAEKALQQVYADNHLEQLDFETEIDCAILGDGCYKVTWEDEHLANNLLPSASRKGRVRVTAPDVQGIYAWWAGDDIARVWKVASRYSLAAEEAEVLYENSKSEILNPKQIQILKLETGSSKLVAVTEIWTDTDFELYLDNRLIEKKANPYGFIPFVIFPNLREPKQFWGSSDLSQLMQPQRELNRAMSQISHILELSGNPVAVLENVDESKDIAVKPGAVWNIPEDAKAYLLDLLKDGGLKLHIDYIELLYRTLHDLSETPRSAFGGANRELSGVAMQIDLYPLIQKVMRKRVIRNSVYNRRNEMILKLLKKFSSPSLETENRPLTNDNLRLRTIWGPVLPQDETRLIENEKILIEKGVHSRRTAMDEIGVKDPQIEFKRWVEEEKEILRINTNNTNTK